MKVQCTRCKSIRTIRPGYEVACCDCDDTTFRPIDFGDRAEAPQSSLGQVLFATLALAAAVGVFLWAFL